MRKPFCRDKRLMIADPQWDDPFCEVDLGECEDCDCESSEHTHYLTRPDSTLLEGRQGEEIGAACPNGTK